MASYDLNQVLKNRKATQNSGTMALDDISRVKVLSPGRQGISHPHADAPGRRRRYTRPAS